MPTYGYRCEKCGHEFDVWQRMSDQAGADCPVCGGAGRRLFFPAGIVFKGGGFYKTDSRKAGGKTDSGKAGGSAPSPSTPSTSTDSPSSSSPTAAAAAD